MGSLSSTVVHFIPYTNHKLLYFTHIQLINYTQPLQCCGKGQHATCKGTQWGQEKLALIEVRVWHLQVVLVDVHLMALIVVDGHNVDIDHPINIASCPIAMTGTTQPALNVMQPLQQLPWGKLAHDCHPHIQEVVARHKAPWGTLNHWRHHAPTITCRQSGDGMAQVGTAIAQIGSYIQIVDHDFSHSLAIKKTEPRHA